MTPFTASLIPAQIKEKKPGQHCTNSQHSNSQQPACHSLSCLEVPHVCRGTPGLLMMALPADFRASIPRCVRSPAGGISPAPPPKKSPPGPTGGGEYKQGRARRRMRQTGRGVKFKKQKAKGLPGSWSSPPLRLLFGDWEPANGRHVRVGCQSCGRVLTTLVIRQCGSASCKSDLKPPPRLIKSYLMSLSRPTGVCEVY